jgi:hypothetical protein
VIPPALGARRRFEEFTPRQALYYAAHADAIMRDFDREDYGAVLREIERHLIEWESQQTPEQRGSRRCADGTTALRARVPRGPHCSATASAERCGRDVKAARHRPRVFAAANDPSSGAGGEEPPRGGR